MKTCRAAAMLVLMVAVVVTGCAREGRTVSPLPPVEPSQADVPSYAELVERYNANIAKLDRLWSTTVVSMRWKDEDGDWQREQGEGHFIYIEPSRVALTVGKVGNTLLWAGSDEERFWLLDLRGDGVAHVGRRENLGRACAEPLPLPVSPDAVPYLLGLLPLDVEAGPIGGRGVQLVDGHYVIEPTGLNLRMMIDVETALPVQVDLLNARGESVVISKLSQHEPVRMEGLAINLGPRVATRAELFAVGEEAEMRLTLSDMNDGRRFNTIRDRTFDYEHLLRVHRPAEVRELDADCP